MDLSYSAEESSFRSEVREWLDANLPTDIRDKVVNYYGLSKDDYLRWHKILAAKGWSVPHWPVEWGGTGWDITQRYIYDEEFGLAGAPALPRSVPQCVRRCCCGLERLRSKSAFCHGSGRAMISGFRAIPSQAPGRIWRH